MIKNRFIIIALITIAIPIIIDTKSKQKEPTFADRQFKKKQLAGAENIDKWITAMLGISAASQLSSDWKINFITKNINPYGFKLKDNNGKITSALILAKLVITLQRMHLHNRYIGCNPFYMIPSMIYFMTVDMASWALK